MSKRQTSPLPPPKVAPMDEIPIVDDSDNISVGFDPDPNEWIEREAKRRNVSKAKVVQDAVTFKMECVQQMKDSKQWQEVNRTMAPWIPTPAAAPKGGPDGS